MAKKPDGKPRYLVFIDTGGTFTDATVVDKNGEFAIGKSPSTPAEPSQGFLKAGDMAVKAMGLKLDDFYSQASVVGFGTTMAANALLNRRGAKVGVILTKGFEHTMVIGRSKQSWLEFDKNDVIHARTHRRDEPIVPLSLIEGVTERINSQGEAVIPLYEHEVREAAERLLEKGVEAIIICFLFSFQNVQHEQRAREIVYEVCKKMDKDVPVYISAEVCPIDRELQRLNTTVTEAYIRPLLVSALREIEMKIKERGYKGSLQVMQAAGGMATMETVKMVETVNSGPVGGLMGGRFIGDVYGFENVITTDVGGTSFDVGLITGGMITTEHEPSVARMLLGTPTACIYSIGAGGGTLISLDPLTKRLQVGPGSAEAVPGPVCYNQGGEIPTTTDCDLILGYIDPGYFLGGTSNIKLNKEKAIETVMKKLAAPLGIDVAEVALGARKILDSRMRDTIIGMVMSRGYSMSRYNLMVFGGAGPTHCAGYTEGLRPKGIMVFPYSATFCAFGAAASDYQHNYIKATTVIVPASASGENIAAACEQLNKGWESLEDTAYEQMEQDGFQRNQVQFKHLAMIRYGRQLDDLTVLSSQPRIENAQDWQKLIALFEKMYGDIFAASAKYPQAGYEVLQIGLVATAPKIKPVLKRHPLDGKEPPREALKGRRDCYFDGGWINTPIMDWDVLKAGNMVSGPAIVESPTTNLVLPPGKTINIDEYLTVWLK